MHVIWVQSYRQMLSGESPAFAGVHSAIVVFLPNKVEKGCYI